MKLRNKLVAVLAASMVVTSVPVVTMADTTNNMSTSRYAQKDGTFGYANGSYGGYDNVYGQTSGIGASVSMKGYDYECSNGFEFTPVFDYATADTTFFSLTADSEFNTRALLTYVDAFNSANGKTNLQFDADGKVVSANNPDYNGKTADELLKAGITMYYAQTGAAGSRVAVSPITVGSFTSNSKVTVADYAAQARKVVVNRMKAAGSSLYTSMSEDDFFNEVASYVALKLVEAMVGAPLPTDAKGKVVYPNKTVGDYGDYDGVKNKVTSATLKEIRDGVSALVAEKGNITTTTYSQMYKASNSGSNLRVYDDIIPATINELNSWAFEAGNLVAGDDTYTQFYAKRFRNNAQATIRKVDMINFKDANDREFKSHLRVDTANKFYKGVTYRLPILAKLGGDKTVLLNVDGKDSNITSGVYSLTQDKLTDKRLSVEAGSETIRPNYMDKIGEIKFTESQIKSLISSGNRKIKIELPHSCDLEFNLTKTLAEAQVKGNRGFFTKETTKTLNATLADRKAEHNDADRLYINYAETNKRRYNDAEIDKQTLIIELPKWSDNTAIGQMLLSGIYVQPQDDTAAIGDVNATISEYVAEGASNSKLIDSTTLKVAEVKEYDVTLKCDTPAAIKAGRSGIVADKKVTFVLEEAVKDSLVEGRKIKFVLENGYIFGPADVDFGKDAANANGMYNVGLYGTAEYKEKAEARFKQLIKDEKIKFEEKAGKDGDKIGFDEDTLTLELDAEGRVIGFTAEYPRLSQDSADKIKVTMPVATDVMSTGEVKVKAENLYTRSFQDKKEDPSCVIANITAPIEVSFDGAKLKVGKQAQEAGSITIKETDKAMIENGWLFLAAQDQEGITFDGVPTVKVEGTDGKVLVVKNVALSKDKTILGIEITKESTEASTIKIEGINLTADRTVPEANYDLAIWGSALTDENELGITNFTQNALYSYRYFNQATDTYVVEKFIQMTTANTEDLSSAAKAVTTEFVIGESKFTVNGETVQMDSKAYIKDGLTFVPVRYLAQAFGIAGNAVQYNKATSTATIIAGDKVINITSGKAELVVNGTPVPMASKAEVKEGRMCVPMAYIAAALGIDKSWDASAKKATFTNQSK